MAFAEDYAMIGMSSGGSSNAMFNIERRFSSTAKDGLDINVLDNETETDVDFMTQLYRNSHPQYFLGSWIVKPIVEILLHYMGYPRVTSKDKNLSDKLNEFYEARKSSLQQLFRELGLFGEEYAILGYDSEMDMPTLKARNKTFIVETRYEDFNNPDELTYISLMEIVKQLKKSTTDSITPETETVTFLKTYWKEENPVYKKAMKNNSSVEGVDKFLYYATLKKRVGESGSYEVVRNKFVNSWNIIPVQPLNQNRLSNDVAGYSDVNGIVKLCGVYHQVFESMIDTNIYNGKPTLVFTGLSDAEKFVSTTYGEINPTTGEVVVAGSYENFGSYYLEGDSNAEYLTVDNGYIDGAKEILRLLFYIYVQSSEVPEWALGAHIDGSYASTKMQSTPLIQKIESKRLAVNDAIVRMNMKLAKIIESNAGEKLFDTYVTQLEWSEPLPEDRDYILAAIDKVIPLDILTNEKILELLDIVANPSDEIKKRETQKKKEAVKNALDEKTLVDKISEKIVVAKRNEINPDGTPIVDDVKKKSSKNKKEVETNDDKNVGEMSTDKALTVLLGENYLSELGLE